MAQVFIEIDIADEPQPSRGGFVSNVYLREYDIKYLIQEALDLIPSLEIIARNASQQFNKKIEYLHFISGCLKSDPVRIGFIELSALNVRVSLFKLYGHAFASFFTPSVDLLIRYAFVDYVYIIILLRSIYLY